MLFSVLVNDGLCVCYTTCGCRQNEFFDIIMIGKMGSIVAVVKCSHCHVKRLHTDIFVLKNNDSIACHLNRNYFDKCFQNGVAWCAGGRTFYKFAFRWMKTKRVCLQRYDWLVHSRRPIRGLNAFLFRST